MDRAEFAINYETSMDLFGNNQIINFKTALPIQNHRSPYTSLSIKNILCEIASDNIIQQSSPSILKTEYFDVRDFYNQKPFVTRKDENVHNSILGEYRVRYDDKIKSTYIFMKKTSIKRSQFYSLTNRMLKFLGVPYKINSSKVSRVQFIPNGDADENIFISEYLLGICGFTQNQLDLMDGRGIDHGYKHFNMKNVVGFIADHQYCQSIIPPINLALNSNSLGSGIHNFTGDTSRQIYSIQNEEQKFSIVKKIKDPIRFDLSKISGGILHVSLSSDDYTQRQLSSRITRLIIHIELQAEAVDVMDKRELIFVKLLSYNHPSQTHQTFIGKLSRSITLKKKNTISLQSVKTGGFMNIPPEHQNVEVYKTYEGVKEHLYIKILHPTFRSYRNFLLCMNSSFEGVGIKFSKEKKHLIIVNENIENIKITPSSLIRQIWGCEDDKENNSIILKPGKPYTFPREIDFHVGIPKVLSIRASLEPHYGFTNTINDHQNIVFLSDSENPPVIEFEDKYSHNSGIFNYIRITFSDIFKKSFCISNNAIYVSFIIENEN
jgi:hypothetical protein